MLETAAAFTLIVLLALLLEPLSARLHLPLSAPLVALGFLGSELLVGFGIDTGLRWYTFSDLVLLVFLPALVFEEAFNLEARSLLGSLGVVLYLAVPLFLLASLATGGLLFLGIGHPAGFPLAAAILTGMLLSATDPGAVSAVLRKRALPSRLRVVIEGESLFNDAGAIVLFGILLGLATHTAGPVNPAAAAGDFLWIFLGGIFLGGLIGTSGALLLHLLRRPLAAAVLSVAVAVFSMYLGERVFKVSGVMAILAAGLIMGATSRRLEISTFPNQLWEFIEFIAHALIFVLAGVTITWRMFETHWLAMLISILVVPLVRFVLLFGLLTPLHWIGWQASFRPRETAFLALGGMQGAATLALALSLPLQLDSWFTVQSIAYGVTLFAIFVQAPLVEPLMNRLLRPGKPHNDPT